MPVVPFLHGSSLLLLFQHESLNSKLPSVRGERHRSCHELEYRPSAAHLFMTSGDNMECHVLRGTLWMTATDSCQEPVQPPRPSNSILIVGTRHVHRCLKQLQPHNCTDTGGLSNVCTANSVKYCGLFLKTKSSVLAYSKWFIHFAR
jgi:hypothetical protein